MMLWLQFTFSFLSCIYILDSLHGGHSDRLESSVVSFLNRKSSATGELLFRRQKVVSYDVLVSLIGIQG
jgi:hypothetical protein